MLYDFDRSVSSRYETPWFLEGADVIVLEKDSCYQWRVSNSEPVQASLSYEKHLMTLSPNGNLHDSMLLLYRGRPAEDLRNEYYSRDSQSVAEDFKRVLAKSILSDVKSVGVNDFLDQTQFVVDASGVSDANVQSIDSLTVITPNDVILNGFRKKMFSSKRANPIDFGVPLSFRIEFQLSVPPGYLYADTLKNRSISGPADASAIATCSVFGNFVDDAVSVSLPQPYLSLAQYKSFISFLDSVLKLARRSLVLKKVVNSADQTAH